MATPSLQLEKRLRQFVKIASLSFLILSIISILPLSAHADGHQVKIGILHSLSGTMAISETSLRDVVLMAVEEINSSGGVLGKQIATVVVDPASDWPLFADKAKQLLTRDKVAVTFGCWTSGQRVSFLPVILKKHHLFQRC